MTHATALALCVAALLGLPLGGLAGDLIDRAIERVRGR